MYKTLEAVHFQLKTINSFGGPMVYDQDCYDKFNHYLRSLVSYTYECHFAADLSSVVVMVEKEIVIVNRKEADALLEHTDEQLPVAPKPPEPVTPDLFQSSTST